MKSITVTLLLIFSASFLFAQQLTDAAITGSWKVADSKINLKLVPVNDSLDHEKQKTLEQMRRAFIGAVFTFKADHEFTIEFAGKLPEFTKELEFLNHRKWEINNGVTIAIGSPEDNFSLMKITTANKLDKKYFILDETPFILEVVKQ